MTPNEIVAAYVNAERLFNAFEHAQKVAGSRQIYFVTEARTRIEQARYILTRFVELDQESRQRYHEVYDLAPADPGGHQDRAAAAHRYPPLLALYAEAFYFFAWRLREVLRTIDGFRKFDAVGVREVRNFLIEHPHKARGVLPRTFTFHCDEGLILKPFGGSAPRVVDRSLYPNADEFVGNLLPLVVAAVKKAPGAAYDAELTDVPPPDRIVT